MDLHASDSMLSLVSNQISIHQEASVGASMYTPKGSVLYRTSAVSALAAFLPGLDINSCSLPLL